VQHVMIPVENERGDIKAVQLIYTHFM